jgi:hypothetical protein
MVQFTFNLTRKTRHMTKGHGPVLYTPDYDRGCHIWDHLGAEYHSYVDEPGIVRDRHGNVVDPAQAGKPAPTPEPTPTPTKRKAK